MKVNMRNYKNPEDYEKVNEFLTRTFNNLKYPNWPQPRWEYALYHPFWKDDFYKYINIWEDDEKIVGMVNIEHSCGEAFIQVDPEYSYIKREMVDWASKNIYETKRDKKRLVIQINEFDEELKEIAESRGFVKIERERPWFTISKFTIPKKFPEIELPEGFKLKSLSEENDLFKLDRCLWRGFNHPGEPEYKIKEREKMQSAPDFDKELNIIAVAPNGEYVAYSGIWMIPGYKTSYVEPVATDPDYRRMGLGKAAVLECIRRVGMRGAESAIVETALQFYLSIGFRPIFQRYPWKKIT